MNKQYVGNDFAKAQTTDKLTPEKVGREISLHSYHPNSSHVNSYLSLSSYLFFLHYRLLPSHFRYQYPLLHFRLIVFLLLQEFPILVIL